MFEIFLRGDKNTLRIFFISLSSRKVFALLAGQIATIVRTVVFLPQRVTSVTFPRG